MKIQPAVTRPAVLILIIGVVFSVQFVGDRKATSETLAQDLSSSATKRTNASDTITGIVLDSSGHPVSGITVDAMPPGLSDDSFRFRQETKTDVGGKFSFEGLPDKAFVLSVQAFSFSNNSEIHVPGDYVVFHIEKGGVITGRVTDINGYPVVHVRVRLEKVKRSDGKPLGRFEQEYTFGLQRSTDDRGIYRIWDVPPGSYLVAAGGKNNDTSPMVTQYDEDAPTYYPSATLGSATPVAVNSGQEIPGIDIQYKGDSGHSITGFVKSTTQSSKNSDLETGVDIFSSSGRYVGNADVADDESNSFVLPNLTDGEYKVVGYRTTNEDLSAISAPITVKIKGNDVNGIVLNIVPLAVISAHVTLDANPQTDCKSSQKRNLEEVVLSFKSEASDDLILSIASGLLAPSVSPSVKGDVSVKRLGGNYHVTAWLPSDDWYIASMTTPSSPRPVDISAVGLLLKSGQKSNLNIVLKNGAASLSGRVIPKTAGSSMPERLLVYLIPMDEARVDERLRFTEAVVQGDETFSLKNIAPGTYRILVREIADESRSPVDTHEGRLELMGEAKSASTIELHSCERQTGFKIKY